MKHAPQPRLVASSCDLIGHLHGNAPGTIPGIVHEQGCATRKPPRSSRRRSSSQPFQPQRNLARMSSFVGNATVGRRAARGDQADLPAYPIGVLTSARKGCDVRETGLRPGSRRFPVFGSSAGSPPCESVPASRRAALRRVHPEGARSSAATPAAASLRVARRSSRARAHGACAAGGKRGHGVSVRLH